MKKSSVDAAHLRWFRQELITHGAAPTITDAQVKKSCDYAASLRAFKAGGRFIVEALRQDLWKGL